MVVHKCIITIHISLVFLVPLKYFSLLRDDYGGTPEHPYGYIARNAVGVLAYIIWVTCPVSCACAYTRSVKIGVIVYVTRHVQKNRTRAYI